MLFETSILSRPGGREVNEDAANWRACAPDSAIWVLADGLGGHGGGEVASQRAVETLLAADPAAEPAWIADRIQAAHERIVAGQNETFELRNMHTTAVLLAAVGERAVWGHCGDSRLYLFRGGQLVEQTIDHSYVQTKVDAGDLQPREIRFHEDRNRLLASLGMSGGVRVTVRPEPLALQPGDAFLLASDGFWELVLETEMEVELAKAPSAESWIAGMHTRLMSRAEGEYDNYTAVAVWVHAGGEQAQ
ncbi:PP2C family protein-serine/threonine phosphatase [Paludibaculum fermentans]|uniref:Serine/threonine-protein phosphatase n=1 Tax=Paludibaculum fermentans TaxID=1473598 RepID=A0A7S7NT02_PALFE|nr:PP2C family serine/threonine-protein phosphatase [Paludibaculum fermentans]QOY89281.1 serine/threonine-protein phosphatase [Paludibaculum fermentans]